MTSLQIKLPTAIYITTHFWRQWQHMLNSFCLYGLGISFFCFCLLVFFLLVKIVYPPPPLKKTPMLHARLQKRWLWKPVCWYDWCPAIICDDYLCTITERIVIYKGCYKCYNPVILLRHWMVFSKNDIYCNLLQLWEIIRYGDLDNIKNDD